MNIIEKKLKLLKEKLLKKEGIEKIQSHSRYEKNKKISSISIWYMKTISKVLYYWNYETKIKQFLRAMKIRTAIQYE